MNIKSLTTVGAAQQLEKYRHRISGNHLVRLLRKWTQCGKNRIETDEYEVEDPTYSTPGHLTIQYTAFMGDVIVAQESFDVGHSMIVKWHYAKANTPKGDTLFRLCVAIAEHHAQNVARIDDVWV